MNSVICTLFEGHYHFGLAALTNSLITSKFKGSIYAGYKGNLPVWAKNAKPVVVSGFDRAVKLVLEGDVEIIFIPLKTSYHLTNYKPDFMLQLLAGPCSQANSIFYFDPDIIINRDWGYFQEWVLAGVALCEDINSPLPKLHPRRVGWRNFYQIHNVLLTFKDPIYANGGFIGLNADDFSFLKIWVEMQVLMGEILGGLHKSSLPGTAELVLGRLDKYEYFSKTDQDALNAAVEAFEGNIAFIGMEAMGFKPGGNIMSHALGSPKPWKKKFLYEAIRGNEPTRFDRAYWNSLNSTIITYSKAEILTKHFCLNLAALMCRFYNRN